MAGQRFSTLRDGLDRYITDTLARLAPDWAHAWARPFFAQRAADLIGQIPDIEAREGVTFRFACITDPRLPLDSICLYEDERAYDNAGALVLDIAPPA